MKIREINQILAPRENKINQGNEGDQAAEGVEGNQDNQGTPGDGLNSGNQKVKEKQGKMRPLR